MGIKLPTVSLGESESTGGPYRIEEVVRVVTTNEDGYQEVVRRSCIMVATSKRINSNPVNNATNLNYVLGASSLAAPRPSNIILYVELVV